MPPVFQTGPLRRAALLLDDRSDGQLLECFLARGDGDAFAGLVGRHGPMVWGVCRRVLRNDADAEDAFQATFLVLVRKAGSLTRPGSLAGWLHGVAHKTALKARAMNRHRTERERRAAAPRPAPDGAGRELLARLDDAVNGLPDHYRVAVVLCDLEGKSLHEAARLLGRPPGTVASRSARGRTLLARRLAGPVALVPVLTREPAPAALVDSTVRAAAAVAAGQAVAVSPRIAALTEAVMNVLKVSKLKALTIAVVAVALLAGGALLTLGPATAAPPTVAPAPADEKPKPDKELLQGSWVETAWGANAEKRPENKRWTLVFEGDKITVVGFGTKEGQKQREGTFTLDAEKKPREIDLTLGSLVLNGIYEMKGTTLKTLWRENDRPGLPPDFDPKKGVLIVFEKKK